MGTWGSSGPKEGTLRAREQAGGTGYGAGSARQTTRPARFDPAHVPDGAHPGYWHAAILFRDLALENGVSLRAGVPVIYAEIRRVFEWFDLEGGTRAFWQRGDGTVELTFAQVYRDAAGRRLPWAEVGEAIIREFWNRQWDSSALEYFCDPDVLTEVARYACEEWQLLRLKTARRESPPPAPQPVTWNRDGHRKRRALNAS
jgi:hypothetical protein